MRFSLILTDLFSVNFEKQLTIRRKENASVVGIQTTYYSDEQEQKQSRKIKYANNVFEGFCHIAKPLLNDYLTQLAIPTNRMHLIG